MWTLWLVGITGLMTIGYFSPYAIRLLQEKRLRTRCGNQHVLVLTYDDGPDRVMTSKLLDLLATERASATFFLMGQRILNTQDVVRRMQDEGHEVASHSYAHLNAWKTLPWQSLQDVQRGFSTLRDYEIPFRLFRPPYGKINLLTWLATVRQGIGFGWWTVVSGDTFRELPDPTSIVQAVERDGGGVVLMHDFDREEERAKYVLDLTRSLLQTARVRGWRVCTLSEVLQHH